MSGRVTLAGVAIREEVSARTRIAGRSDIARYSGVAPKAAGARNGRP